MAGNIIIDSYLKLKKEYIDLVESDKDPKLLSLTRDQLWYFSTRMNEKEIELLGKYSEEEKLWYESFIKRNKDQYIQVEKQWTKERKEREKKGLLLYSERPEEERRKIFNEGMNAAVQYYFSQSGVMGGLLKQLVEVGKVIVSKGICPICQNKLSAGQIKQFQEGQKIKCESCNFSTQDGEGLTKIIEDLEEKGEVMSSKELKKRGVFLGKKLSETLSKYKESD